MNATIVTISRDAQLFASAVAFSIGLSSCTRSTPVDPNEKETPGTSDEENGSDGDIETDSDFDTDTSVCREEEISVVDYSVESPSDLKAIAGYSAIKGQLNIGASVTSISRLNCLERVGGSQ